MMMSQRERYIAGGIGTAIGLVVLLYAVIFPQKEAWDKLYTDIEKVKAKVEQSRKTLASAEKLRTTWVDWQKQGLGLPGSEAELLVQKELEDWLDESGAISKNFVRASAADKGWIKITW